VASVRANQVTGMSVPGELKWGAAIGCSAKSVTADFYDVPHSSDLQMGQRL